MQKVNYVKFENIATSLEVSVTPSPNVYLRSIFNKLSLLKN